MAVNGVMNCGNALLLSIALIVDGQVDRPREARPVLQTPRLPLVEQKKKKKRPVWPTWTLLQANAITESGAAGPTRTTKVVTTEIRLTHCGLALGLT